MINISKNSIFNLKPIEIEEIRSEVNGLLIPGEEIISAFKTVRDQMIFTDKRIISVDIQGLTGTRKSYSSLPYSKVQFFAVQTPGLLEIVPDSELVLSFANGFTATFEFKGNTNIIALSQVLAKYIL
jgi:hypothetical protein